jgi:hypothetical protein
MMKSYDEDKGILLRFIEREGKAGTFLTRIDCLPPLNFDREQTILNSLQYRKTAKTVIKLQSHLKK